jgi:3-deoxy-manno-octulosonate cytidylyltransferase (CMP-KDO synthetase)
MSRVLGVIPARYGSTRLPGKPLASVGPSTLIAEVWRRASSARRIDRLVVATDDERIARALDGTRAEVLMTSSAHPSGTDRVAEVSERLGPEYDVVVNVQGDEALVTGTSLDLLAEAMTADATLDMATLAEPMGTIEELLDPNVVKVVLDGQGCALYFSRSPIPYHRDPATPAADLVQALARRPAALAGYLKHQGVYAYRREVLLALTRAEPSPLERDECLEQLRALQAGRRIRVLASDFRSLAVDTPADLARLRECTRTAATEAQGAREGADR